MKIRYTRLFSSLILVLLFTCPHLLAADAPYIAVGTAKTKKTILAMPPVKFLLKEKDRNKLAVKIEQIIKNDLAFMDLFKFLPATAFLEKPDAGLTPESFKFTDWSSLGTEILIKAGVLNEGKTVKLHGYLYDVIRAKNILTKEYVGEIDNVSDIAHSFANNIVETLTGRPGIFRSEITMSCESQGKKEIYVMNYDGSELRQITHHRSIAFAPAWSPDRSRIAYSLYTRHQGNIKNIDLYEYDFKTGHSLLLSSRRGMNSGASYSPDGKYITLTMSFLGNPEIFMLNRQDMSIKQLTQSFGFDVDPVWSPSGKEIAFSSTRTGKAMIFRMDTSGNNVQRLTIAGQYNATPSWSPMNNKIAFAAWIDDRFDIYIMNPEGTGLERLTKKQGYNEDPSFSPDGGFIAFSSDRTGKKNIYVMNIDGTFVKRLTYGLGNCVAPRWSTP